MQPNENLYDQKPEEPAPVVTASVDTTTTSGSFHTSRFEYVENIHSVSSSSGAPVIGHVAPPRSSSFFEDFGMDTGFQKKPSSTSSKVQV